MSLLIGRKMNEENGKWNGKKKRRKNGKIEIAKKMKEKGYNDEDIKELTGLRKINIKKL